MTVRGIVVVWICLLVACGARTELGRAGDGGPNPNCLADGTECSATSACCTTCVDGICGAPAPTCHPGDTVVTLHQYPSSSCALMLFGLTPRYAYYPDSTGLFRVAKAGGAPEKILDGFALSAHANDLGVFADMRVDGCVMAPCGRLVRVRGAQDAVLLAADIGNIFLLEPWHADNILVAHTYPDPGGQVSFGNVDGGGLTTLAHYQAAVVRPTVDGDSFYVSDSTTAGLLRIDLGAQTKELVQGASEVASTPAVIGDFVYFTDYQGNLVRIPKVGGTQSVFVPGFNAIAGRASLIANGDDVIFDELPTTPGPNSGNDGKIVAVNTVTAQVHVLASGPDVAPVSFLAADDACVYWTEARWASESSSECASVALKRAPR